MERKKTILFEQCLQHNEDQSRKNYRSTIIPLVNTRKEIIPIALGMALSYFSKGRDLKNKEKGQLPFKAILAKHVHMGDFIGF